MRTTIYISSTYKYARCGSAECSLARSKRCDECLSPPRPGCNNNTCTLMPLNPVIGSEGNFEEVGQDVISLHSTDGSNPTKIVSVPNLLFVCSQTFLLTQLAAGVKGIAGLGRAKIGLPSQFASVLASRENSPCACPPQEDHTASYSSGTGHTICFPVLMYLSLLSTPR